MSKPEVCIYFFDTTLRDGDQALPEGHQFATTGNKPDIAGQIARLGVNCIEAGFPGTPHDAERVAEISRSIGQGEFLVADWRNGEPVGETRRSIAIAGLSRAVRSDIEATWGAIEQAEEPRIHTFIATDSKHMRIKFPDKSPAKVSQMGVNAVRFAREISADHEGATVEFSAEAATTTNIHDLERVVKGVIEAGADVINIPDTEGQRSPFGMLGLYKKILGWIATANPEVVLSAHNHNDLGLAVANSLALVYAASEIAVEQKRRVPIQIESTVCGLGERAGNADIFSVAAGLFQFAPSIPADIYWQFNPGESVSVAEAVMPKIPASSGVPRQSPVVGSDINVHRSGIHSNAVIKAGEGTTIYSPLDSMFWGHKKSAIIGDGNYQGALGRRFVAESRGIIG